jgi:HlyD family secretion protein
MRRAIIITVVIVAVGAAGYWLFQQGSVSAAGVPEDLETVTVERGDIEATVDATGTVEPVAQVTLSFRTGGTLEAVMAEEGDEVEAGDVLAQLRTAELELGVTQAELALTNAEANLSRIQGGADPQDIEAAGSNLASAEAALARLRNGPTQDEITVARADLKRAEIALQEAQERYDEYAWVGGVGALPFSAALQQATINYEQALAAYNITMAGPTESELRAAEAAVAQARSQLDSLLEGASEEDLIIAQVAVDQARASLELAQLQLEDATMVAPFSGTVGLVGAQRNEQVGPGVPIVTLIDPSSFHVDVRVDEVDVGQVEVGQGVRSTLDAFPDEELLGQVEYISPVASMELGTASYLVRASFDPHAVPVRSGMTANIAIVTQRKEDVLLVPSRAISIDREEGLFFAGKLVNGEIERADVEIGLQDESLSEVLSGLQEGDQVVISGPDLMERLRLSMRGGSPH